MYKTDSFCPQSLDYKYMDRIISDIGEDEDKNKARSRNCGLRAREATREGGGQCWSASPGAPLRELTTEQGWELQETSKTRGNGRGSFQAIKTSSSSGAQHLPNSTLITSKLQSECSEGKAHVLLNFASPAITSGPGKWTRN